VRRRWLDGPGPENETGLKPAMRSLVVSAILMSVCLAACDAVEESRRTIEQACRDNGDPAEVCDCLGRESALRLDPQILGLMVMGARGDSREASEKARMLDPAIQSQLAVEVPAIMAECGMARS
jgi:hypothetical protein